MADVGLICVVDLSTQKLAVELLTQNSTCLWVLVRRVLLAFLQTLSKYAQSSTCLASYYYLEFLPVSYV